MSDADPDRGQVDRSAIDRRALLRRLLLGTAFVAPMIASFSMAGAAQDTTGLPSNSTQGGGVDQTGMPSNSTATSPAPVSDPGNSKPGSVNLSGSAKAAASTTSPGYEASLGADNDPTTSWFSTGPGRDGTSTYTLTFPKPVTVTSIEFVGNERNQNPDFRTGYGFRSWSIDLLDAGGNVRSTVQSTGSGTVSQNHDVPGVEGVVVARFVGRQHESLECGGFAELRVFGF